MEDIPQQPPHAPLIVNNTEDNNNNDDNDAAGSGNNDDDDVDVGKDEDYDDSSDKDDNNVPAAETDVQEGNESDGDQGVRRSRRRGKGTSKKYNDHSLLMASMQARRGGQLGPSFATYVFSFHQTISATQSPFPRRTGRSSHLGLLSCITR